MKYNLKQEQLIKIRLKKKSLTQKLQRLEKIKKLKN